MVFSSRTLVLECAADRVACALFEHTAQGLALRSIASQLLPATIRGASVSVWADAVGVAWGELARSTKRSPADIVLLVPASLVLLKPVHLPPVSAEQRARILPFEVAQAVPYALTELGWGTTPIAESAQGTDLLLAAVKNTALYALCGAAEQAGFAPGWVLPAPLATLAGFGGGRPRGPEIFLGVEATAEGGTIVLAGNGPPAIRSFSFSRTKGASGPLTAAPVDEGLGDTGTKLTQEIARTLLHFETRSSGGQLPVGIQLAGPLSTDRTVVHAITEKYGSHVSVVDVLQGVALANDDVKIAVQHYPGSWLILVGAATLVRDAGGVKINLLPAEVRARQARARRRPWFALAAGVVLIAAALPMPFLIAQRHAVADARANFLRAVAPERERAEQNADRLRQISQLRAEIQVLEAVVSSRRGWLQVLGELDSAFSATEGAWLAELGVDDAKPGAPARLHLKGFLLDAEGAPDLATSKRVNALFGQLARLPRYTGIEGVRFDRPAPGLMAFELTLVCAESNPF